MKCKKCGSNEWYERGKYKRCIPCHNKTQLASYHNRKLGISAGKKSGRQANPLSKQLKTFSQKKLQTLCSRGHELAEDNVRLEVDRAGRVHRRCKKCEHLRLRRRYGLETHSELAKMLDDKQAGPMKALEDIE